MKNKNGNTENLTEYHSNGKLAYNYWTELNGSTFELTYNKMGQCLTFKENNDYVSETTYYENGNEKTYQNSNGESRAYDLEGNQKNSDTSEGIGYNPFTLRGTNIGGTNTSLGTDYTCPISTYSNPVMDINIPDSICVKKVIGWYCLHSKSQQHTLSIATHTKPNFIKRFFMRTLLDFYWIKDGNSTETKSKIKISKVVWVFLGILLSIYSLIVFFIFFKTIITLLINIL